MSERKNMAERRMMSKKVIHSDDFMDLPATTKNLYFYLMIEADDDGFVNSPKRIQRMIGGTDDDAKLLLAKKFIISFESGVIVIKHWRMHNYIRSDRYKATTYTKEAEKLNLKDNGIYTLDTVGIPSVNIGKDRLGEDSIGKVSLVKSKKNNKKEFSFSLSKKQSYDNLSKEYKEKLKAKCLLIDGDISRYEDFVTQLEAKGYQYKDFSRAYMSWDKERKYKSYKPTQEPQLGEEWVRILGGNYAIAINTKTLEMKEGMVTNTNSEQKEQTTKREVKLNSVTDLAKAVRV